MRRIYSLILTFLLIFTATLSFHIAPTFFEKRIDGSGGYQEYIFKNNTNSMVRYKVSFLPGLGRFSHMNDWIEYSPKILTIKPQSESVLKVFIKAPKGIPEGEYSAVLNMKTINLPKLEKDDGKSVAAKTRLNVDISLELIGYYGNLEPKLEVSNLKLDENKDKKLVLSFNVKNRTFKRGVYYTIDILGKNGIYTSLEKGRVEPNKIDDIKITLPKAKKSDILGVVLRDPSTNEKITQEEL